MRCAHTCSQAREAEKRGCIVDTLVQFTGKPENSLGELTMSLPDSEHCLRRPRCLMYD